MNLFSYIKTKLPILDVISEYATLKKAGLYWKGHCPFHNEKTASFTVSPHKEIFYCFGCHMGGDVIAFIAKIESCSQLEATQHLIERYGLEIPAELKHGSTDNNTFDEKKRYNALCETVAHWCHENLLKSSTALHYLQERGVNPESIKHFTLGYFPSGTRSVQRCIAAAKQKHFMPQDLIAAGILQEGKNTLYSPFEERIIFPIKDHLGRFCGFGGRIFKPADERAKYYNSKEHDYFSKGHLLFGLDAAKKEIKKHEAVFLVEGYTDCVAMVQHGYKNTVATLGTACTDTHLKELARYAQSMYVLYDSDKAGTHAILRLTELCWQVAMELNVICLPPQEDPASFLQKNGALGTHIDQAKTIFEFFIDTLGKGFSQKHLQEKLLLVRKITDIIRTIDDPLKRDILLQRAAHAFEISYESLQKELGSKQRSTAKKGQMPPQNVQNDSLKKVLILEKKLFSVIMNNIQLFNKENEKYLIEYFPPPLRGILQKLKELKAAYPSLDFIQFFDELDEREKWYVSKLLLESEEDAEPRAFDHLLLQFQKKNWKDMVHSIKVKLAQAKSSKDKEQVHALLNDFLMLKKKLLHKNLI